MDLHHPVFQSGILPALLAFGGTALVRFMLGAQRGAAWASVAIAFAVAVALFHLLGRLEAPVSVTQKLPWVVAAAALLGLVLEVRAASGVASSVVAVAAWVAVLAWFGMREAVQFAGVAVTGAVVIALIVFAVRERGSSANLITARPAAPDTAVPLAVTAVAALGLAALTFMGGSLVLAQAAGLLAAALGAGALWFWPRDRLRFGITVAVTAAIAWCAIAAAAVIVTPTPPLALAALALAFVAVPVGARWRGTRAVVVAPIVAAVLAAVCVAGALALASHTAGRSGGMPGGADDPYLDRPK